MTYAGTVSRETHDAIVEAFEQHNLIPWIDAEAAHDGYLNVVVGICPPGTWGHNLVLRVEPEEAAE